MLTFDAPDRDAMLTQGLVTIDSREIMDVGGRTGQCPSRGQLLTRGAVMADPTPVQTNEQWWTDQNIGSRWRTARKEHRCTCGATIAKGERYFDTMELIEPPWQTAKLCSPCAGRSL